MTAEAEAIAAVIKQAHAYIGAVESLATAERERLRRQRDALARRLRQVLDATRHHLREAGTEPPEALRELLDAADAWVQIFETED